MQKKLLYTALLSLFLCSTAQVHAQSDKRWDYKKFRESQKTFNSSDGKIRYIDEGKGKAILLLHGVPTSSWLYRKMIDDLVEEGFKPPVKMKKGGLAKISMWMYKNGITTNMLLNALFKKGLIKNELTKNEIEGYKLPLREGKTNGMYFFFTQTCNRFPHYDPILEILF